MQTKTVYEYLGNNVIIKGVYDWLYKEDSGLLAALPRKVVKDNGVKYNVDTTYPTATWTDVGDVIPENSGAFTQRSAALYRLIHDIDVDKSEIAQNATQDKEAVEIMRQMRGFMNSWQKNLIYGQTTTESSTKQSKGLIRLLAELESESTTDLDGAALATSGNNTQFVTTGDNTALSIAAIEVLADAVKLGVDAYVMTRKTRRYLNSLARASGILMQVEKDKWNHNLEYFNGAPIYINDWLGDNFPDASSAVLTTSTMSQAQAVAAGYDNSIIFALNMSDDGVHIIQTGDIEKEPKFTVQNKDAWRHRVKWYNGLACYNKFALAGLFCLPAAA